MNSYFPNPFMFPKRKKNCRRLFPAFPSSFPPIVRDRFLYVSSALNNTGEIYNIINPTTPAHVGQFNTGNSSFLSGLAITSTTLYVANQNKNMIGIYNISNPISPVHVGEFNGGDLNSLNGLAVFTLFSW
ncbi:hypothetical protein [Bacillus sp. GeD10]|uniref:hypothetical protein n=1 Tax=Bacillus sp. GeD10 TaxID=1301086 RepID=UPI0002D24708|nr:hypothetical protein [Bacillus sp. GeD10]CCW09370.1 hypothetical protein EBGED10_61160 [Bacillus sp. GeD10]